MAVFLTTVFVFDPGERKIGERFALVIDLQAAGLVGFGKDDAGTIQINGRLAGECCTDQHQAQAFQWSEFHHNLLTRQHKLRKVSEV